MIKELLARHRRNEKFSKNLPLYRFALRRWMWRGKKRLNEEAYTRWQVIQALETHVLAWQIRSGWLTWFFIEPPEETIKDILSWR
jgi:hypothetical protein